MTQQANNGSRILTRLPRRRAKSAGDRWARARHWSSDTSASRPKNVCITAGWDKLSFSFADLPAVVTSGRVRAIARVNAMDISAWLRDLGLDRYGQAFRENAIDEASLPKLTAEDLTDLGVTAVGHRRILVDAIAALRAETFRETTECSVEPDRSRGKTPEAERRQLTVMFCDLGDTIPNNIARFERAFLFVYGFFAGWKTA